MALDLIGTKFGQLTVLKKLGSKYIVTSKVYRTFWECRCICGKVTEKTTDALRSGKVNSCGCCEWHIHHNEAYVSWCSMKQRCDYKLNKDYPSYGGRGIKYDPRWTSFVEFYLDMGDPPVDTYTKERLSLDRKDNNGDYCKDNCKWSTRSEQQFNKGGY